MRFQDNASHPYIFSVKGNFEGVSNSRSIRIRTDMDVKVDSPLDKLFYGLSHFVSFPKDLIISWKATFAFSVTSSGFKPPKG
jgi:hypothetical protein